MPNSHVGNGRRLLAQALAIALVGAAAGDGSNAATLKPHASLRGPAVKNGEEPAGSAIAITTCADSGPGSLRAAMLAAHNNAVVDFSLLACSTITLTTGALTDPNVDSMHLLAPLKIIGGRVVPAITIDGNGLDRVIDHRSGGELELFGLDLRNGIATDKGGCIYAMGRVQAIATTIEGCVTMSGGTTNALGGGIWSDDQVDLLASTVSGNTAQANGTGYAYGGGVFTPYGFSARYSTIANNAAIGFSYGGGVSVLGPALVEASVIHHNTAQYGAGIAMFGNVGADELQVINSTIAFNHALGFAGGIEASGALDVFNTTIANNVGDHARDAAGIVIEGAHALNLVSSIVYGNLQGGVAQDIAGSSITGSADLIGHTPLTPPPGTRTDGPKLEPLADNGGQTFTMKLRADSPAIDHGSNPTGALCDQRSGWFGPLGVVVLPFARISGPAADIGAYEVDQRDDFFKDGFETPVQVDCYAS